MINVPNVSIAHSCCSKWVKTGYLFQGIKSSEIFKSTQTYTYSTVSKCLSVIKKIIISNMDRSMQQLHVMRHIQIHGQNLWISIFLNCVFKTTRKLLLNGNN